MNTPTKTALRAALQQEGEALASRLPDPADALAVAPAVAETVVPPAPPVLEPVPAAASPVAAVSAEVVKPAPKRAAAGSSAKAVASAKVKVAVPAAAPKLKVDKVVAEKPVKADKPKALKAEKPVKVAKPEKVEKLEKPAKASREKVVRDSFSMPKSEHAQLKSLREGLAKTGRICTKSELLRAGVQLLLKENADSVKALVEGLAVVPKGKSAK